MSRVLDPNPETVQGFSLIPPTSVWPDSSLAQMVEWISEVLPTRYIVENESFERQIRVRCDSVTSQPVWLFATAFHLVDLIDSGKACLLPPGSVVIETGGTKGKTRSVSRDQLYSMIETALGVPQERIVSEYGMCELASQAYDFVDREGVSPPNRYFRFPAWVRLSAMTAVATPERSGQGILLVDDPLRIDHPWPLRTEDLVLLEEGPDQRFALIGRLDRAPLKGCSLLAEATSTLWTATSEVHERRDRKILPPALGGGIGCSVEKPLTEMSGSPDLLFRATHFLESMSRWLDARTTAVLAHELGSSLAAEAAIQDVFKSLPASPEALVAAALCSQSDAMPTQWLFVLPRSHSLVGLYPLAMGYVLGLKMSVRVPLVLAGEQGFIQSFLSLIANLPQAEVRIVSPQFRIGSNLDLDGIQAVLAYGDDETIHEIRRAASVPVFGFGGRLGLSLASGQDFLDQVPAIVRDAFTLAQRGCMATRLVLVHDPDFNLDREAVVLALQNATQDFWAADIPWQVRASLDAEAFRLARLGFEIPWSSSNSWPLVAVKPLNIQKLNHLPPDVAARVPFTLPVVWVQGGSRSDFILEVRDLFRRYPPVAACSMTAPLLAELRSVLPEKSHLYRALGAANAPLWDGSHEGFPLFSSPVLS